MKTLLFLLLLAVPALADIPAGPLRISPQSLDLIVEFETGGRSYYTSRLAKPTYPGGASGVTIGIGYDCGYNSADRIKADWSSLPTAHRDALAATAGVTGARAKVRASALRWIVVPWSSAEGVFVSNTLPRFGAYTNTAFPGVVRSHGHIQGALLSVVFNRGPSMSGSRRVEMRNIRSHVAVSRYRLIPGEIRSMKRLWVGKGLPGLLRRRDAEAKLVELAL